MLEGAGVACGLASLNGGLRLLGEDGREGGVVLISGFIETLVEPRFWVGEAECGVADQGADHMEGCVLVDAFQGLKDVVDPIEGGIGGVDDLGILILLVHTAMYGAGRRLK